MLLTATQSVHARKSSEVLIVPFWKTAKGIKEATAVKLAEALIPVTLGDFQAKEGELALVYTATGTEKRLLLVGLGAADDITPDVVRLACHHAAKFCLEKKLSRLSILVPEFSEPESLRAVCDGFLLADYDWPHQKKKHTTHLQLIGLPAAELKTFKRFQTIAEGVYLARDLVNESAHTVTPQYLADLAVQLAKKSSGALTATVFDAAQIAAHKMGLLLAVARGAAVEPRFIMLSYRGRPKSRDHTVLIGKGVTYDTGGLNLKPTGSMETMRCDMAGAATALATVATAATLKLPCNVTAVIPSTENAIGATSYKPGDVFVAYDGTTVEIGNTDAEGRLILADAIAYTLKHLAPTRVIDWATLTGAIVVALGDGIAGLFANDAVLSTALQQAADTVGEPLWPMPLYLPYDEKLKSKVADLSNVGGRAGGAILGALFLKRFVSKSVPWAHIDFAGPAFLDKEFREWPHHGVGFGVRLLIEFLEQLK